MLYSVLVSLVRGHSVDFLGILATILASLVVVFLILPLHELAHGWVAYKLGDSTAKYSGRLTLNPLAHIDPMGALSILLFGIGWAKPVPVDPRNFKNPKAGMAITAAAGPLSNLLAATVGAFLWYAVNIPLGFSTTGFGYIIVKFLATYITINISLAVFNLIPIPPFDGYRIVSIFLSNRMLYKISQYERYGMILVFVLLLTGVLDAPLNFCNTVITNGILWLTGLPFHALLR